MSATPIGAVLLSARRSSAMVPLMTAQDIRRMLELLAAIDSHLANIETLLASVLEKPTFVEWGEPGARADKPQEPEPWEPEP
jgi:hypothetical protein